MKKVCERPTPLIDLPHEQDPAQIALLIRSARSAPDEDTPGVTWRIRNTLSRRTERRARALRFAVVGAVIFVAGAVVGAVMHPILRTRASVSAPPTVTSPPTRAHRGRRPAPPALPAPTTMPEEQAASAPTEIPPPVEAPAAPALSLLAMKDKPKSGPVRRPARPPVPEIQPAPQPPPAPAAAPAPVTSSTEQALVSSALGKLRVSHEPAAALALLEEYRTRFPDGVLAAEATRLRREALLLLGRKATVLDELDRTSALEPTGDALVLRGELRASAGRWQAALADFDAVVRAHTNGAEISDKRQRDRIERALWGRASAHSRLGHDDATCADLGESLRRFPHGRFAGPAKQLFDKECEP